MQLLFLREATSRLVRGKTFDTFMAKKKKSINMWACAPQCNAVEQGGYNFRAVLLQLKNVASAALGATEPVEVTRSEIEFYAAAACRRKCQR